MSKTKLTAAEWQMVKDAPFWVNRVLTAADGRVAFFAKRREAKALEKAMNNYKTSNALLKDMVADDSDPAKEIEKASQEDAELALGRIATIVEQKLGDDDLKALQVFLVEAGRAVASASREGGIGMGKTISDKEEAALKRIESALRPSAYTQAKPAPKPAGAAATGTTAKPAPKPAATTPKPAAAQPKPAPATPKRDDDDDEAKAKAKEEAKARQERARKEAAAKVEARKEEEAKERLEKARQEAEARQREAAAEREAKAKAEAEASAAREEAARKEAEAKAAAEKQAASAPKYTEFIAEHTVQAGDNLSFISQRYYGHQGNFRIIYEANRDVIGDNMNLIRPGQVLKIPKL